MRRAAWGSPWDFFLYLDERGDEQQRAALQAILTGSWGGAALVQFPWAFKPSRQLGVRTVPIEVQHHARRRWFRAGEYVDVRVGDPVGGQEPVTCGSRATTSRGPSVTVNCCG